MNLIVGKFYKLRIKIGDRVLTFTCKILKIDIEGSEFALFKMNVEWLSKVKKIAMEVHTDFGNPEEIKKTLSEHDFKVLFLNNDLRIVKTITQSSGYLYASR